MLSVRQEAMLDSAFLWCCRQRRAAPADADIWHLRWHWARLRPELAISLSTGDYRLRPMLLTGRGRDRQVMWGAQDAVVLKWVALQFQAILPVHPLCEHHKGHGGGRLSVQRMHRSLQTRQWRYVCRTDIRGFYGHIRRSPLMRQIRRYVKDPLLLSLVHQYLHYSVEDGGEF